MKQVSNFIYYLVEEFMSTVMIGVIIGSQLFYLNA